MEYWIVNERKELSFYLPLRAENIVIALSWESASLSLHSISHPWIEVGDVRNNCGVLNPLQSFGNGYDVYVLKVVQ
jgi:hypothetical protein